jgi:dipeptidyl aminopeptidase/acylaminoacyl peptidase
MTTRHQLEFGTVTFFGLAMCIGVFLAIYNNNNLKVKTTYALPSAESIRTPIIAPIFTAKEETISQPSPDGTKKITIVAVSAEDSTKTYTLTTANGDNSGQIRIYSTTLPDSESISVPFNSFSPDNKYLFVIHHKAEINEALVFRTDGEKMTETEQYSKVAETFTAEEIKDSYKETTGWASETLLIVNTTPENDSKQSYWFEVPGKAIITLSTEFYD